VVFQSPSDHHEHPGPRWASFPEGPDPHLGVHHEDDVDGGPDLLPNYPKIEILVQTGLSPNLTRPCKKSSIFEQLSFLSWSTKSSLDRDIQRHTFLPK